MMAAMHSPLEIERKFLVAAVPQGLELGQGTAIRQGYLAIAEDSEVRLRDSGGRYFLAVKIGRGLVRREHQVELEEAQFEVLWPATEGRRLCKLRHRLEVAGSEAVVDVFEGDLGGLIVAEVEFESEAAAARFVAPDWFSAEVTDDPRYANRELAVAGSPTR